MFIPFPLNYNCLKCHFEYKTLAEVWLLPQIQIIIYREVVKNKNSQMIVKFPYHTHSHIGGADFYNRCRYHTMSLLGTGTDTYQFIAIC